MYTLPHLTAQQTLLPQNLDDGDDHGLWHAPTVATSHVSDTLPQQQRAGGTRAALAAASIDLSVLCADDSVVRTRRVFFYLTLINWTAIFDS